MERSIAKEGRRSRRRSESFIEHDNLVTTQTLLKFTFHNLVRELQTSYLRLMADAAADDVHHRFDEGQLLEEFVVRNRFHFPNFFERLDKHDGYG